MINKQKSFLRASLLIIACMLFAAPLGARQEGENKTEQQNQPEQKVESFELDLPIGNNTNNTQQQETTEQQPQPKQNPSTQDVSTSTNNLYPNLNPTTEVTASQSNNSSSDTSTLNHAPVNNYEVTPRMLIQALLFTCGGIAFLFALSRLLSQPTKPIQSFVMHAPHYPHPIIIQPINATHNHVIFYGSTHIR